MKLQPNKTAILSLDFQKGILNMVARAEAAIPAAEKIVAFARKNHFHIVHVGLGFAQGYPEIPEHSAFGTRVKNHNAFIKGSVSSEFHAKIFLPEELIVFKQRVGAFSENELHMILRAKGIENLVLFGISTSGITLSTLRRAFDLDYRCTVIKDACFDPDPEVHRVLVDKVFANQATVMAADAFIAEQS